MVEIRELLVITHEDFRAHAPPDESPESPERIARALESIEELSGSLPRGRRVRVVSSPRGSLSFFSIVHSKSYLRTLKRLMRVDKPRYIDSNTYVSPGTRTALERLAGGATRAVVSALAGKSVFLLARPPSHHAGVRGAALGSDSLGFCLVNATAAIASVLSTHGGVAVVDFDAHHGNGTAEVFYDRGDVLHVDIHFDPRRVYPHTGYPSETGAGDGEGTKINIVLPQLAGDDVALDSLKIVDIALKSWSPDYVVVSAGFDSYRGDFDPVQSNIGTRFFHKLGELAARHARKSVVAVLEGGYGAGLKRGLQAFLAGLMKVEEYPWDPLVGSSRRALREYTLFKLELLLSIYDKGKIDLPYRDKRTLASIRKAVSMGAKRRTILKLARRLSI